MAKRIADNVRIAIAAALAAGMTQHEVAKQYSVSRTTVALVKAMGSTVANDANPLAGDWRTRHKLKAIKAVDRLDEIEDASKAVTQGVQVLKGLGEYDSDGGQTKVEVWLQSPAVQQIVAKWEAIDVKPVESISEGDKSEP